MFYLKLCNDFSNLYPYLWGINKKRYLASEDYNKIGGLKVFEFSGFRSDKVCHLRLGFWRNVTRRHGEDGGLLKQSNGSHGGTVGAWSNGACLPVLLAIYTQSVYPKRVIKNLYATPPSLFVPSAPLWHCIYLRPLRDSVCLYIRLLVYHSIFLKNHIYFLKLCIIAFFSSAFWASLFASKAFFLRWYCITFLPKRAAIESSER